MVDQEEIHRKCNSADPEERLDAIIQLNDTFEYFPEKKLAWQDLHRLTSDQNSDVRRSAIRAIGTVFEYVPDKEKAWQDLHRLTEDEVHCLRREAVEALRIVFRDVPEKEQAWKDLHRLTLDKNKYVRLEAEETLKIIFRTVPDKQQAWKDLVRLTSDEYSYLRSEATKVLGIVFKNLPDEQQAWEDLHRLASDEDKYVQREITGVFGTVFEHIPDKEQAWEDLHILTSDKDIDVRVGAYHSCGRISIYKASQSESEEGYLEELEKAIEFFEKAMKESNLWNNPSSFCLPFYRSFYAIVSAKKQEAKDEVKKYLLEAKNEIYGSENKKLLFEAVENLANALKEVQNLENLDLEAKKGELDFYRKYCEQASELMRNTEETVPYATAIIRKGLPILDRKIKSLLEEIQEKAKTACQKSKGTDTEEIACAVSREVQKWEIGSQEEMTWYVENLVFTLESTIPRTPKNQHIFDRIRQIREERDVIRQYAIVCTIIPLIPLLSMDEKIINMEQGISDLKTGLGEVNKNTIVIIKKLDEIQEELKESFEKLDKLSVKVGGKEGENIKVFSEKLLEMTKKGDSKAIEHFLEELLKDESALIKEIDDSSAPNTEKEESKRSISKLRSLLDSVKNPTKAFGKDVAKEIVVGYAAKGIIDLIIPMMFLVVFGVPMPSHITDILAIVTKELKQ